MNRLTRGLYTKLVCQIKGLNGIIKSEGAVVDTTRHVGKGAGIDSQLRSIIVDIGGESSIVGSLVMSTSPFAATTVAVALSMGGSVTTHTTVWSTLLLLLSELGVHRLALDST